MWTVHLRKRQVKRKANIKAWLQRKNGVFPAFTCFRSCPALSLSLLGCRQACVTQVATRPGRISAQEDFLPSQLEHLHIAQFKGLSLNQMILFSVRLYI